VTRITGWPSTGKRARNTRKPSRIACRSAGRWQKEFGPLEKGIQHGQRLYRPEGQQAGRFERAAPLARKDSRIAQAGHTQTGAQPSRLVAAAGIEIALRGAVADDEIRRVAEPRRMGMTQHQHTARSRQFAKWQRQLIGPRRQGACHRRQ